MRVGSALAIEHRLQLLHCQPVDSTRCMQLRLSGLESAIKTAITHGDELTSGSATLWAPRRALQPSCDARPVVDVRTRESGGVH